MAAGEGDRIGQRITEARHRKGLTQAQLAAAISIDRSALAKIENGSRRVTALELSRIADTLGERIEWFIKEAPATIVSHRNLQDPGAPSPQIDRLVEHLARNVEFAVGHDDKVAEELKPPHLAIRYVESVLRLYRSTTISAARAIDLLMDTWCEDDLPVLDPLPESVIWKFVS
ncbi:helix-turn-helix transcriptional regulator [Sphaerisporangium sp. NPDC051011]|uniref:helix-turn-helix domain-containing protein n=1 Tax=Sphaerisporangium sp. NPDC051011 TaxID=3155792 RepID=UPI0033C08704